MARTRGERAHASGKLGAMTQCLAWHVEDGTGVQSPVSVGIQVGFFGKQANSIGETAERAILD